MNAEDMLSPSSFSRRFACTASFSILACVGALASRYAVPFAFRYSMGFLPLAVAILLFLLYRSQLPKVLNISRASHRCAIACAVTALLFSAFLVIGSWDICEDSGDLNPLHALAIIANAFPIYVLLILFMSWLDIVSVRMQQRTQRSNAFRLERKGSLIVFVVLLLCWLPVFLAAFPGFFCYDMTGRPTCEYTQFVTGQLNSEYPIVHVLLLGSIISTGENLLGSFNAGVALFVCIQALIVSAIFTFGVHVISNTSASKLITIATIAYLGLNPVISIFVSCTTRDTLFSAFAVLFAVLLFTFFRSESAQRGHRGRRLAALGVTATMVCYLRPNGIIGIVVLIPFLILFMKGTRARLAMTAMCAATLMACWLWFGPIASVLGVASPSTTRALIFSIPSQQMTTVVENGSARMSELQMLLDADYGFLEEDGSVTQNAPMPQLADTARWNFERMTLQDVLSAYVTLGLGHPMEYFEAFVTLTQAVWNPYAFADVYLTPEGIDLDEGRQSSLFRCEWDEPASSQSLMPWLLEAIDDLTKHLTLQNIPLLSLLVAIPLYSWLLILVLLRTIVTLDKSVAAPCILLFTLTLTAFFGPGALIRYYLPIIFGLPLMMLLLATARSSLPSPAQTGLQGGDDGVY